jgi:hypothetical protein
MLQLKFSAKLANIEDNLEFSRRDTTESPSSTTENYRINQPESLKLNVRRRFQISGLKTPAFRFKLGVLEQIRGLLKSALSN